MTTVRRISALRVTTGVIAAIVLVATGFIAWLGYFGGPLFTDVPATGPRKPYAAIYLSSDTGFRIGMAPDMAHRLAADGIAVVGVNTLTYLRTTRTPAEIVALVARAERRAMALGRTDHVVMIGQSFGADMLHVGLAGLPGDLRKSVIKAVLIVPEDTVEFRASPSEIFDYGTPVFPAILTARRLTWVPTLCVQGVEEPASLCPLMYRQANVTRVALPGGHPLKHDPDALYAALSRFVLGR